MWVRHRIASLGQMIASQRGRRGGGYVVFTGAGASVSSGYPLGEKVKDRYLELLYPCKSPGSQRELFKKEHSRSPTFANVSRTVLDQYGKDKARHWIRPLFQMGKPSSGYESLAELTVEGYFADFLYTANWDNALELVLPRSRAIIREADMRYDPDVDFDIFKVHGDFDQPDTMVWEQNQVQDWLVERLRSAVRKYAIIFVGYSASDRDIVEALRPAFESGGPREAWFVGPGDGTVPTEIAEPLGASGNPSNALSVEFDDFMQRLSEAIRGAAAPLKTEDRQELPARSLHSRVYRIVRSENPVILESPLPFDGRWHPPRERALYATLSPASALAEVLARRIPGDFKTVPFDLVELEVQLDKVLDLLDPMTRVAMQIDGRILSDRHLSRGIAARARDAGLEALIAPSRYSPSGKVLVVFLDALLPNSRVTVLNRHRVANGG
ncbi:RES domain-containing protein [Rubrobacter tropicus]|uniref:RES domain-containing protein n=1 Tax=Rubrobacter tropicus TaxID=2653851 RepID=A0A6G8QD32_9ACTN|nr:RES domain-containing protein [Rubrobacter tropicus]QIN84405.1 RES domain-containing protein [Rubrobacter tropicus]